MNGEAVPLYKNKGTWVCSASGMIKEVAGEVGKTIAKKVGDSATDTALSKLNELLDKSDAELDEYIKESKDDLSGYLEKTYDTIIKDNAESAIQQLQVLATDAMREYILVEKESEQMEQMVVHVRTNLDKWLAEESKKHKEDDIAYVAKREAVKAIDDVVIKDFIKAIKDAKKKPEEEINKLGETLMGKIRNIRKEISDKIQGNTAIEKYKADMVKEFKESLKGGAKKVKKVLSKKIDGIFGENQLPGTENAGLSSFISFRYSDYLRLFLMIGLFANPEGLILRTADAVQSNMALATGNDEYKLSNSSAYVEINATILVKPILLGLPVFSEVEDNPVNNEKWYKIDYKGIKGY